MNQTLAKVKQVLLPQTYLSEHPVVQTTDTEQDALRLNAQITTYAGKQLPTSPDVIVNTQAESYSGSARIGGKRADA